MLGEPRADSHALPGVEAVERALGDVALDARQALEVGLAYAAHQRRAGIVGRSGERLALDQRQRQRDAGHLADAVGHRVVVGQRLVDALEEDVAVEADHLLHQVVMKTVHHRHDDDQRHQRRGAAFSDEPG